MTETNSRAASERTILITGANGGIGSAIARRAAREGYSVALHFRSEAAQAEDVRVEIAATGVAATCIRADLSTAAGASELFTRFFAWRPRLDALVNNAGTIRHQSRFEDIDAERLDLIVRANFYSTFWCAQHAVRHMAYRHGGAGGAIVNISSIAAQLGAPLEYVDYAASKAAIEAMTIGLSKEVASEGIRVNCVRPGTIDTPIHTLGGEPGRVKRVAGTIPMGRGGEPGEVAEAVLWLASDAASYVTGAILPVSGGK